MFQADPSGILGLVAVAMCWALAVVLYRVGPTGSVARMLALLLAVEGITLLSSGVIFDLLDPAVFERLAAISPSLPDSVGQANFIVHTLGDCAMLALYPAFLAAALQTKLTRPFADKRMRIAIAVTSVALFVAVQLTPWEVGATLLYLALSLLFGFALVASINAWFVAAPGIARARAGTFALAFGFRDICWGFVYGVGIWQIFIGTYYTAADDMAFVQHIYRFGTLVYVPIIAYGILRTQLFDIDLRIRWTIKQSTLAAIVVTLMFLLSEGADRLLSAELGNVAGLLAAGVVVFFLAPLQRFAERVASVAMPNTENTPQYVAYRKMQVYEAALTEALPDGSISERERALLNRLRDSLDISSADAETLERELQAS